MLNLPLCSQEYQPSRPLGAGMCAGVLLAMTGNQQWAHAYDVIKAGGRGGRMLMTPCRQAVKVGTGMHCHTLC